MSKRSKCSSTRYGPYSKTQSIWAATGDLLCFAGAAAGGETAPHSILQYVVYFLFYTLEIQNGYR